MPLAAGCLGGCSLLGSSGGQSGPDGHAEPDRSQQTGQIQPERGVVVIEEEGCDVDRDEHQAEDEHRDSDPNRAPRGWRATHRCSIPVNLAARTSSLYSEGTAACGAFSV